MQPSPPLRPNSGTGPLLSPHQPVLKQSMKTCLFSNGWMASQSAPYPVGQALNQLEQLVLVLLVHAPVLQRNVRPDDFAFTLVYDGSMKQCVKDRTSCWRSMKRCVKDHISCWRLPMSAIGALCATGIIYMLYVVFSWGLICWVQFEEYFIDVF